MTVKAKPEKQIKQVENILTKLGNKWDKILAVNLTSYFLASQIFGRFMVEQGEGGSIINVSSTAALHGYPMRSAYSASKWGMMGLMKTWAMELGPEGIRVNAVCPNEVNTPMLRISYFGLSFVKMKASFVRSTAASPFG